MKPPSLLLCSLVRWALRQMLTTLVVLGGAALGWWMRQAAGPALLSETMSSPPPGWDRPRPAPLVAADLAARSWLEEAAGVSHPSGSLVTLQQQLDAGQVSDFSRLARELLSHPLPLFRQQALASLFPAWGARDPSGALQFLADFRHDLPGGTGQDGLAFQFGIVRSWTTGAPAAALEFLTPARLAQLHIPERWFFQTLLSEGSVPERLRLIETTRGEAALGRMLSEQAADVLNEKFWERSNRQHPPEDWRALASEATDPRLKQWYQFVALRSWMEAAQTAPPTLEQVKTWFADTLAPQVELEAIRCGPPESIAELLRSDQGTQLSERQQRDLFNRLVGSRPDLARDLVREGRSGSHLSLSLLSHTAQGEPEIRAWLNALPEPAQRQALLQQWLQPAIKADSAGQLAAAAARALSFGPEGAPVAADSLAHSSGSLAQQVPEIFASLPSDFQTHHRLDVVLGLAHRAPDAAAEIWMDAPPEELARPGAAVVAEELAHKLFARDPGVASAWILQLPPGESRDRAAARLVEQLATEDPQGAATWTATIHDPVARARALTALDQAASPPTP